MDNNEPITFTLDYPDAANEIGLQFWHNFYSNILLLRKKCSDENTFHNFPITKNVFDPPQTNVIFQLTDRGQQLAVTVRCERCAVYFIGVRSGRGEPQEDDPNNNKGWLDCGDETYHMPEGTPKASFMLTYSGNVTSVPLSFERLRQAVINLYYDSKQASDFHTLCLLVAEPVRYEHIAQYYQYRFTEYFYAEFRLNVEMGLLIKNWGKISTIILKHFHYGEEVFVVEIKKLRGLNLSNIRKVVGLLKYDKDVMEEKKKEKEKKTEEEDAEEEGEEEQDDGDDGDDGDDYDWNSWV